MCGIAGRISARSFDEQELQAATAQVAHRGPDDSGVSCFASGEWRIGLGNRRLSILDLSARGHQPMSTADGKLHIVYNGELYNFAEIRRQLERDGFHFRTGTDTEVVLQAYARWGIDCLARLNGMFAFAIWDDRGQRLVLVRDRLGVKPLYYAPCGGGLAFASEVKSLLCFSDVPRRLNHGVLGKYLMYLWVPDPHTLFDGIYKLPPANYGLFQQGKWEVQPYWDLQPHSAPCALSESAMAEAVLEKLREAVRRRLVSDVPVGVFLSGGLDSSLITMLMRDEVQEPIRACTVAFTARDLRYDIVPDDLKYARMVRDLLQEKIRHSELELQPECSALLPKLVWHLDEPVADPAAISTYLICRAARDEATVMLTGVGGEELFAGYPRHRAIQLARALSFLPRRMRNGTLSALLARLPGSRPGPFMSHIRNLKKFARGLDGDTLPEQYLRMRGYYSEPELKELLLGDGIGNVHREHLELFERMQHLDALSQVLYVDTKTFLPCLNLTYIDKASMAASVEVREPLLDHEFVQFVAQLPSQFKLRGRQGKYILKKAAERVLPKPLVWRKKTGFTAPIRAWLMGPLRPLVHELLSREVIEHRGLVRFAVVEKILHDQWSGREDNALRIWALLNLEIWLRTFVDRDGREPLAPETAAAAYRNL